MKIITSIKEMQCLSAQYKGKRRTIGLVPTMGALHNGHLSLIRKSKQENQVTVVSIFVNPIQFGPREDYKKYPRPLKKDAKLLKNEKVDILFMPSARDMYGDKNSVYVIEEKLSNHLCGRSRPRHFKGVMTVVCKLFNIIGPTKAYFGKKDYQQLIIIKKMVNDLNMPVNIIGCPIIREYDGLALSSRNSYLTPAERIKALSVYNSLQKAAEMIKSNIFIGTIYNTIKKIWKQMPGCSLEYVKIVDPQTLEEKKSNNGFSRIMIAARIGKTRLIDTMLYHSALNISLPHRRKRMQIRVKEEK